MLAGRHWGGLFRAGDIVGAAEAITSACVRGGKKYLPTANSSGTFGWLVEVTEGAAVA